MRAWRLAQGAPPGHGSAEHAQAISLHECEAERPTLTADEILVQVRSTVLGTPERSSLGAAPAPGPIPGGVALGRVVEAGEQAGHMLDKSVIIGPEQGCGECDICRRGEPISCPRGAYLGRTIDGTLAQYARARARWACTLEPPLSSPLLDNPAAVLLGREAAWAYAMFARAGVAPGEPVFVLGHDLVARFLVQVAVAKGVRPMVLLAPHLAEHASWIEARGAIPVTADALQPDTPADLRPIAERAARAHGHGQRPWFVFETTARATDRRAALSLVAPGSKLTLLASRALGHPSTDRVPDRVPDPVSDPVPSIDPVLDAGATILGVCGAHPDLLPEVVALVVREELDLSDAAPAFSLASHPESDASAPLVLPAHDGHDGHDGHEGSSPRDWILTLPPTS